MTKILNSKLLTKPSLYFTFLAGFLILISLTPIVVNENFTLWYIAKAFYALGVLLFVFNK